MAVTVEGEQYKPNPMPREGAELHRYLEEELHKIAEAMRNIIDAVESIP